jgi:NAD(P)H dehydrogenase (quinone)
MKIGISGANGQLGKAVLDHLSALGGQELVGISRNPETVAADVEARFGDYSQPDSLSKAYAGLDRLLIIPSADLRPDVRGPQFRNAIDAAVASGVRQIVFISLQGTRKIETPSMVHDFWVGEQHLIANAPSWTILRSGYYAEAFAQEVRMSSDYGVLTGLGSESVAYMGRDDLARSAAAVLVGGPEHDGAIYQISGPERVTGEQKAAMVNELLGKKMEFIVLAEGDLRSGLVGANLPAEIVEAIIETKRDAAAHNLDYLSGDVERLTGRAPQTLRQVLAAHLQ